VHWLSTVSVAFSIVLWYVTIWDTLCVNCNDADLCAVLSPCGPLKWLINLAQEREEPIPALLYEGISQTQPAPASFAHCTDWCDSHRNTGRIGCYVYDALRSSGWSLQSDFTGPAGTGERERERESRCECPSRASKTCCCCRKSGSAISGQKPYDLFMTSPVVCSWC